MSLVPSIVKFTSANYRCIIVPFPYPDSESVAIAPPMCRALIGIITMSRKKGDLLRLKKHEKRSNTIFEDTTSARIRVSTGSTDFKRIDLLNDKSRSLLHKILIGDNQEFTPLPPSQLCVSSTSTDELNRQAETAETTREKDAEPSRLTSNLTETAITTRENDEEQPSKLTSSLTETTTKVSDTEPLKWTPFPPPDVNAILSQMSLVRLTLEQLCAPISDDEEEEDGIKETQCGNSDVYIQQNSKEQSASTNDVTIPTHSSVKPPVTISHAASSDDIEVSASTHGTAECSTSIKTQAGRRNTKSGQPITNSSRNESEAQPSNSKRTSTTVSLKESRHPPKPPAGKPCKPLEPQQLLHSEFIDLTDSSDEVNYQKPKKAGSSSHLSTSNPKGTAQNQASCDNEPSRRSEGKQPQSHPTEAEDEFDQLCMDIDLDTIDDFSDEEEVGPSHASDSLCNTSTTNTSSAVIYSGQKSNKMKTYDHGSRKGKSSIRDSQLSKHNPLPRKSSSDNARVASLQPPVVNTISAQYTTSAPSQSACPPPTACEKRGKRPNDFEVSLRAKQPRLEDLSHPPLRQVPSASISKGQSTSKNTRNVRVATAVDDDGVGSISSQELNTEHCPMCNTKFPAWYEQVDADEHIAQCLQAVMDLELENDLQLL